MNRPTPTLIPLPSSRVFSASQHEGYIPDEPTDERLAAWMAKAGRCVDFVRRFVQWFDESEQGKDYKMSKEDMQKAFLLEARSLLNK